MLESCILSYYAVLTQHNITPQISVTDKKIERTLNENALSRIFGNIINNAVKYSDGDLDVSLTAVSYTHLSALDAAFPPRSVRRV